MNRWKHDVLLRIVKFLNIILISFPFALCWVNYYAPKTASRYYWKGNALIIALFFILYLTYGRIYECFMISMNRISELIYSQCLAALISDGIMYVVAWLLIKRLPEVLPFFTIFAAQGILSCLWSLGAHWWYFRTFPPLKSMIVFDTREGLEHLIGEYGLDKKFQVEQTVFVADCLRRLDMLKLVFLHILRDINI